MSRVRPTRAQTRARLIESALAVFERDGIAATTVESIVAAAGYSRGAFYSSFQSIDDLVLSVIEQQVESSIGRLRRLRDEYPNASDFLAALARREGQDASTAEQIRQSRILEVELNLYVLRNATNRPRLVERLQSLRTEVAEMIELYFASISQVPPLQPEEFASLLIAMDDGLAIHSMLDPAAYSPDTFFVWLSALVPKH